MRTKGRTQRLQALFRVVAARRHGDELSPRLLGGACAAVRLEQRRRVAIAGSARELVEPPAHLGKPSAQLDGLAPAHALLLARPRLVADPVTNRAGPGDASEETEREDEDRHGSRHVDGDARGRPGEPCDEGHEERRGQNERLREPHSLRSLTGRDRSGGPRVGDAPVQLDAFELEARAFLLGAGEEAAVLRRESLETHEILRETVPSEVVPPLLEEALGVREIARRRKLGAKHLLEARAFGVREAGGRPEAASRFLCLPRREPQALGVGGPRRLEDLRAVPALFAQPVHGGEGAVGEELGLRRERPRLALGLALPWRAPTRESLAGSRAPGGAPGPRRARRSPRPVGLRHTPGSIRRDAPRPVPRPRDGPPGPFAAVSGPPRASRAARSRCPRRSSRPRRARASPGEPRRESSARARPTPRRRPSRRCARARRSGRRRANRGRGCSATRRPSRGTALP